MATYEQEVHVKLDVEQALERLRVVTEELEEVHRKRGLTVGDALTVIALFGFMAGWLYFWVMRPDTDSKEVKELSDLAILMWIVLVAAPSFWAANHINSIIRKE